MRNAFKIHRIESEDEIDWVYAQGSLLDVLKWYTEEISVDLNDLDSITVLPRKEWKNGKIVIEDPEGEEDIVETFEQYCNGSKSNEIIASSRWD